MDNINLAVLLTCYNRKQKTLDFLESLTMQPFFEKLHIDIYLLDDASTDGTEATVKEKYPYIKILTGTGSLFWAGGMRVVWEYAIAQKTYDLFLLFNDDIILFYDALERLFTNYVRLNKKGVILIGSTLSQETNKLSYGGYSLHNMQHSNYYAVEPDNYKTISCQLGNANVLIADAATVEKIGIFSGAYTHFLADFDYTLTACKAGLEVLIAPGYYAYCEDDHGVNWLSTDHSLKKRIEYLYSPKGLAYKEYLIYIKKHFPLDYFSAITKLWAKTLFPIIWDKFKRRDRK